MMYRVLFLSCLLAGLSSEVALAAPQTPEEKAQALAAERHLLQDEMEKFVKRGQWNGAERTYLKLIELGLDLRPEDHLWGYNSAVQSGDMAEGHRRLKRAIPPTLVPPEDGSVPPELTGAGAEVWNALVGIESRYGVVSIHVAEGRVPALVRFEMPFSPEERTTIEYGRETLLKQRIFEGFLPVGRYMVDGKFFDVEAGLKGLVVQVGEAAAVKPEPAVGPKVEPKPEAPAPGEKPKRP